MNSANDQTSHNQSLPIVVLYPFVGDSVGGSTISTIMIVEALARDSNICTRIVLHKSGSLSRWLENRGVEFTYCKNIKPVKLTGNVVYSLYQLIRTFIHVKRYLVSENVDVLHTNDGQTHLTWTLGCIGKQTKHIWHQRTKFTDSRLTKLLAYFPQKIVVISTFVERSMPITNTDAVIRIPNPITAEYHSPNKVHGKMLLFNWTVDQANETFVISFVGALNNQKRILDFLKIIERMKNIEKPKLHFLIVGKTGDFSHNEITSSIRSSILSPTFNVLPFQDSVNKIYEASDVLIAPAENEAFGRNLIEAMERSVIVIASNSGGHSEIVDHDSTGYLVDLGDIGGYVNTISKILVSKKDNGIITRKARNKVIKMYELEKIKRQIKKLYYAILQEN